MTVAGKTEEKPDSLPSVDISMNTSPAIKLKNPNEHVFNTKNDKNQNRIDYNNLKQDNISHQPVLFEKLSQMHLTRSKYVITSFLKFEQYYTGFNHLENFSSRLLSEISKLSETEMPYFIRRYNEKENTLLDLFKAHKEEAVQLTRMLENYKLKFDKLLDHMSSKHSTRRSKQSVIHSIFNFLFGSEDNSETIQQIKSNLEILEQNEQNLGDELMRQLELIDKSNIQITQNRAVINTLNRELIQLNNSLNSVSEGLKELEFSKNFILAMLQVRNHLDMMRDGIENLKEDLTKIQEYMMSLTTHKVSPNLIPPTDLRNILNDISKKLITNPKLSLPIHENADIWSYYQFLKIDAFVHSNMLIVVLVLPLIDKELEFDLYRAHSLPLLHPELKKVFTYEIDSPYIAIRSDNNYFTLPHSNDVMKCQISAGNFCNLNTALYPTESTMKCIYHLLANNDEKIKKYCTISISKYTQDTAINLEGNTWALAVLEPIKLHVTCLTYSYQIDVKTSFKLVELENSCQAYSPNIILPSGNQMSEKRENSLIKQRFFNYDEGYISIPNFFLMQTFNITKLSSEQIDKLSNDLPIITRTPIHNVTALLREINKNYPFELPIYGYVSIAIGGTVLIMLVIGVLYYAKYRRAKAKRLKRQWSKPISNSEIELQPTASRIMGKQANDVLNGELKEPAKVTPLLLQQKLEDELGIDFSSYEKYKHKLGKPVQLPDQRSKIV